MKMPRLVNRCIGVTVATLCWAEAQAAQPDGPLDEDGELSVYYLDGMVPEALKIAASGEDYEYSSGPHLTLLTNWYRHSVHYAFDHLCDYRGENCAWQTSRASVPPASYGSVVAEAREAVARGAAMSSDVWLERLVEAAEVSTVTEKECSAVLTTLALIEDRGAIVLDVPGFREARSDTMTIIIHDTTYQLSMDVRDEPTGEAILSVELEGGSNTSVGLLGRAIQSGLQECYKDAS